MNHEVTSLLLLHLLSVEFLSPKLRSRHHHIKSFKSGTRPSGSSVLVASHHSRVTVVTHTRTCTGDSSEFHADGRTPMMARPPPPSNDSAPFSLPGPARGRWWQCFSDGWCCERLRRGRCADGSPVFVAACLRCLTRKPWPARELRGSRQHPQTHRQVLLAVLSCLQL